MYACLHVAASVTPVALQELALQFSPVVEQASERTVVFSIDPLRKLIGSPPSDRFRDFACRL